MNSGPRWLKEGVLVALWSASAVNVYIYTMKTVWGVYKAPPLSAWQGGGLMSKSEAEAHPNRELTPKEKKLFAEKKVKKGAGKALLKTEEDVEKLLKTLTSPLKVL